MIGAFSLFVLSIFLTTAIARPNVEQKLLPKLKPTTGLFLRRPSRYHRKSLCGTKLTVRVPTPDYIRKNIFGSHAIQYNHDSVGMTHPCLSQKHALLVSEKDSADDNTHKHWWPSCSIDGKKHGWRTIRMRSENVGRGESCYRRVRDAALNWEFSSNSMGMMASSASSQRNENNCVTNENFYRYGGGRKLATYTAKRFLKNIVYVINPVLVVYDLVDERSNDATYSSTAYATAKGHWLCGEERVSVIIRDTTGNVDIEILSFSKPNKKFIWPFIGNMQQRFFKNQMQALVEVAKSTNEDEEKTLPFGLYPSLAFKPSSSICYPKVMNASNRKVF